MTEKLEIYKCLECGNIVQVLISGNGVLVCCGENMERLTPKYEENNELAEKHEPIFEENENGKFITLRNHPMSEEHYIQFIEVIAKDKSKFCLKYLNPNEPAEFDISDCKSDLEALEHCNIHGLWRSKND